MSNQTNVYLVDAQILYERDAREVDLREPTNLLKPPGYVPFLQWLRRKLERKGNEEDHHYAFHEIEELLLFGGGAGFGSPGIDFATQFEKGWALRAAQGPHRQGGRPPARVQDDTDSEKPTLIGTAGTSARLVPSTSSVDPIEKSEA